ncbi:MAG: family 78 glycoside hydrolase catalytic domain [Clostridia bacterium]|nr:family 78 glycoside hydrolase catalytic domain [Clostridia bacterium]
MGHDFKGKWITDGEFFELAPRNVFFKQLERIKLPCEEHRNRHILFRKRVTLDTTPQNATMYITADDYYKLYINGRFVAQGPSPSYHFQYNYNVLDVSDFLTDGENVIAVHTLYQGLINRVWQSGDNRHGLLFDLVADGKTVAVSDESVLTAPHTAYTEMSEVGYHTQFMERYDSRAAEVGFEAPLFDDAAWENARLHRTSDHTVAEQTSKMLVFEDKPPFSITKEGDCVTYDFGACYVGYLRVSAKGKAGDRVRLRFAQELWPDGRIRHELRANCVYEEEWVLADGISVLDQFDYKSFRYAELLLPEGVELVDVHFEARHYPFRLKTAMRPEFADDPDLQRIWKLCLHTQKYGVQEVIQDCMEREKGFYLGDGCYTALTYMLLSGDDSMVKKLIDDAFATEFISDTLMTCMDCSFMQEIGEYPLMMIYLIMWHYRITGDLAYLQYNYPRVVRLLDAYQKHYEQECLLKNVDKWCVVEWPKNFQHDYAVDITEGKVCEEAHVSLNAYYIEAVKTANRMAGVLSLSPYRDEAPLLDAFKAAFFDGEAHLFNDGEANDHKSLVGNSFVYAFNHFEDKEFDKAFLEMYDSQGIHTLSLFCTFMVLYRFAKDRNFDRMKQALLDEGAWLRILREDGTATFEGWGKDTKKNGSLFHLTMSYAAVFLCDTALDEIF